MAIIPVSTLKAAFESGDTPTGSDFANNQEMHSDNSNLIYFTKKLLCIYDSI